MAKVLELQLYQVLPVSFQDWFPLGWTDLISLQSKGFFSRVFSSTTIQKHQFFSAQPSLWSSPHNHTCLLEKPYLWLYGSLSAKVIFLLLNMPFRFVIGFPPRSKHLLISQLQSPSTVILESKKIKSVALSIVPLSVCHAVMGLDAMILDFWMLSFKPDFSLSPLLPHQKAL